MDFLMNYSLYKAAGDAAGQASRAEIKSDNAQMQITDLKRRILYLEGWLDVMTIGVSALTELLEEKGITKEMLQAKIQEIDQRDGVADAKITRQMTACPHCGHENNPRRPNCLYCGQSLAI